MFTTLTVLLATAAAAQAASSASASATSAPASSTAAAAANPYIPSSISSTCSAYLTTLNSDTDLPACTSALTSALSAFAPANSTSASKSEVTDTLTTICASSFLAACPQSLITGKLASFYTACGPELTSSPNDEVKATYDIFYTVLPFLSAVCTKDDSGAWCVPQANTTATGLSASTPLAGSTTASTPNAAAISANNILYLFTSPSLPKAQLCTDCTAAVLKSFMTFQKNTNYAPGLGQSVFMSGQPTLYSGVVATCGADFLSGAVAAAGGLSQGTGTGTSAAGRNAGSVLAVAAGAVGAMLLL
ncbi:hypothetical protein K438DRAFT_1829661 [Mycena galopus ATCC 62051]|nr:hypothetical protein K438DRAFT_1829661 [Mycena galopus ATCC 62051]